MQKAKLNIFKTEQEVISNIANYFVEIADQAITANGIFNISLSGGSSPKKLYEMLASPDYKEKVDWKKVYFFFGDERNVPVDHPDSNFLMVKTALFDPLHIQADHVFAVDTVVLPESAAIDYAERIKNHFKNQEVQFDLVLLGLGDNSHTASLFPHTPILHDQESTIKAVFLEDQQVYRISMTAAMINNAHHIAFLLYGGGKAEAVHHVLEDSENIEEYPAQLIQTENGDLQWFMDEAAASLLTKKSL
ncbi:MAG: 6-phosphogluconolactonase [Janthinobacterium lividum]